MNTNKDRFLAVASLLDRLIDAEPDKSRDATTSYHQQFTALRMSVRRDLENLLNTRCNECTWPLRWHHLDRSLMAYGIVDITGRVLDTVALQDKLRRELTAAITIFEPRLQNVDVTLLDTGIPNDRILRLRIHAWLCAEPVPEPVIFDSLLKPEAGSFHVIDSDD